MGETWGRGKGSLHAFSSARLEGSQHGDAANTGRYPRQSWIVPISGESEWRAEPKYRSVPNEL
jgi:hypothetical protein